MSMPSTNADGTAADEFTEELKFIFDTRGWIALPGVLNDDEVVEMREFSYRLQREPESIPEHHRSSIGGPLERLTDHPIVLGFMNEFVASGHSNEECYGFRLESTFLTIRDKGQDHFRPHGGRGMLNFPGNSHTYHMHPGKVHSGLTRVCVGTELCEKRLRRNDVFDGKPQSRLFHRQNRLRTGIVRCGEDYSCPAGSVLFFTEAITHSGARWEDDTFDRVAIFNCYNVIGNKWHNWEPHPEHLAEMPFKRSTLFRPVYCQDNVPSVPRGV